PDTPTNSTGNVSNDGNGNTSTADTAVEDREIISSGVSSRRGSASLNGWGTYNRAHTRDEDLVESGIDGEEEELEKFAGFGSVMEDTDETENDALTVNLSE